MNPILVVIDGPFERAELERVLGTEFKVTTTENTAGALRALAGRAFDAVVIDLELHGENAKIVHEFLQQAAPRLADRAVIFGSGARDPELAEWAQGFGTKYVRREDIFGLLDVVREVANAEWQS